MDADKDWQSMTPCFRRYAVLATVLLALAPRGPATACGYEGVPGNSFGMIHPGSFEVAYAIRQAIDAGLLEEPAATAAMQGQAGYWAAVRRLDRLQALLAASPAAQTLAATSMIFVDSSLWSRFTPATGGVALEVHTAGPAADDLVLVTGEGVLAAVLEGRLTAAVALERGLILLEGEPAAVAALSVVLQQALADPGAAAVAAKPKLRLFKD